MTRGRIGPAVLGVTCLLAAGSAARADDTAPPDEAPKKFEGAIGLVSVYGPEYAGSKGNTVHLTPAGFIRYGRITVSGAGGFTTRRKDEVERGLAASLVSRDRLKVSLALRFDGGRSESDSNDLAGMGDIKSTVRARLLAHWSPDDVWRFSSSVSVDMLGKHGGYWGDLGVTRQWQLAPRTSLQVGSTLTLAGDQYLQTWYGVTPEQSARSVYPVFKPGEGARDVSLHSTLRTEFTPRWGGFVSAGASHLLGAAADSPLTKRVNTWQVGAGLAWRF